MSKIAEEITSLRDRDGLIRVTKVHDWAKSHPQSDLHGSLEWDDARAGYRYRLDQIRRLIEVHIVIPETGTRATVSLTIDRSKGGGYRPLQDVLPNPSMRAMLVAQVLDELERVVDRYPQLAELNDLSSQISNLRRSISMPMAAD
jgi:hypothetical protein